MTFSEDKYCPILLAGRILSHSAGGPTSSPCIREKCEWYGHGCPAYPTQLEIDIYKQDKEFYKELEERNVKSD